MDWKYKYEMVAENIREEILGGSYPTGKLPSETEFMERFQVGKITVYNALKKLAEDGIITRTKKKGTYANIPSKPKSDTKQVGVFVRQTDHFYSDLSTSIKENLLDKLFFPVFIDFNSRKSSIDNLLNKQQQILNNFLNSPSYGIIFEGEGYFRNQFLKKFPETQSVVVNNFEAPGEIPGSAVLADYQHGTFLAVSHLIAKGHKKIILFNNVVEELKDATEIHRQRHPGVQRATGYSEAMKEHGLEGYRKIVYRYSSEVSHLNNLAFEVLTSHDRPTAIVCDYDFFALRIIEVAAELKIKVPEDLAIFGHWDTPWCEMSPVKISSISFNPEEMGRRAVEIITSEEKIKEIIKIKPELVLREST